MSARKGAPRRAPKKAAAPRLPLADRLVQAVAENQLRRYASEYLSDHLTWRDFADTAREDVATVLRALGSVDSGLGEPREVFVYHGEATNRPVVYVSDFVLAAAEQIRVVARAVESGGSGASGVTT